MTSLLNQAFQNARNENRPALLTYTVAGDNTKKNSLNILKALSKYVDICELGFPHNTPIADGGQIQTSAYRAIKNGIKIKDVFEIVKNSLIKEKVGLVILSTTSKLLQIDFIKVVFPDPILPSKQTILFSIFGIIFSDAIISISSIE